MNSIYQLPIELLDHIVMLLSGPTIQALSQTCPQFRSFYRDESFWRRKYERDYGRVSWNELAEEFTELLPGNWRRAYYCRWLTRRYSTITPYIKVNRHMIEHRLNEGHLRKGELTHATLQSLGLWDRQRAFQNLWDHYYGNVDWSLPDPNNESMTFDDAQADINKTLDEKIKRKEEDESICRIGQTIELSDFNDLHPESDVVGLNDTLDPAEKWIYADTIVTPKIITFIIDPYDKSIKSLVGISDFNPKFRLFEYTYATPTRGFTVKEFFLKARDALERYCYMCSLVWRKLYADISNISVVKFEYRLGRYYLKSYSLGT
jgi:hypothetical protein